ncbi:MAG: autotransporter outer membrane beta-barrel domain-containing protein [Deltaproteobacteria bacterium]|nr:autotransporter outer membrane beta-barrel domain-containing protein [Deltaproteobacteria bacterium]
MSKVESNPSSGKWAFRVGRSHLKRLVWPLIMMVMALALGAGEAGAADRPFSGSPADLQTLIYNNAVVAGDQIIFGASVNLNYPDTVNALRISKANLTLTGASTISFDSNVANLVIELLPIGTANQTGPLADLVAATKPKVDAISGSFPTTNTITGTSRTNPDSNTATLELKKIIEISVDGLGTSLGSGLSLTNLSFKNSATTYTYTPPGAGGVVNSFIGSNFNTSRAVSLRNITGNSFDTISVTLHGASDQNYLAGGGILGLRSTANSASIDLISGNLFRNLTVKTDASGTSGSAYLEGGGIIGIDAVSSPATPAGYAFLHALNSNLFTKININSGDIILGGGLLGVNNNSRNTANPDMTYSKIDLVSDNIFGSGESNDISVSAGFSLRGGGIVGVNGLSNAAVELTSLYQNTFGGINVDVKSYLRGGGIVGLQNNDNDLDKPVHDNFTVESGSLSVDLEYAVENLFYNLNISVGDQANSSLQRGELSGGGVIGLSSGPNSAFLNLFVNNIFKGINVTSKTNSGIIKGGGIIGVNSQWWSTMTGGTGNYFDDIVIKGEGGLSGGGVIGLHAEDVTGQAAQLALGSVLTANTFHTITTDITGDIRGGGIIGASTDGGTNSPNQSRTGFTSIDSNIFGAASKNISISASNISGGGLIGAYSTSGDAYFTSINNNAIENGKVNVAARGNILGGGIIGTVTGVPSTGVSSVQYLMNTDISEQTVTVGGHLTGGGIIGSASIGNSGDANIAYAYSDIFINNLVNVTGYIEGGGILGVRSAHVASIGSIELSWFSGNIINTGQFIDGGGIIGVTGPVNTSNPNVRYGITEIKDTYFGENEITASNGQIAGGLIYSYGLNSPLTISGSVFENNTFTAQKVYGTITIDTGMPPANTQNTVNSVVLRADAGDVAYFKNNKITEGNAPARYNSFYFGRVPIMTETGGTITYADDFARSDAELIIDAKGSIELFDPIEVNQNNQSNGQNRAFAMSVYGPGNFFWGGQNTFNTGTITGTNIPNIINFYSGSNTTLLEGMGLVAPDHLLHLSASASIVFAGDHDLTLKGGTLYGTMQFDLAKTKVNDPNTAVVRIKGSTDTISVQGAVVKLGNVPTITGQLKNGDMFYLITTEADGQLTGNTYTRAFTGRQGFFGTYDFIIDKQGQRGENQDLVARLAQNVTPTPDPPTPQPTPQEPDPPTPPPPPILPDTPDLPQPPDKPVPTPDTPASPPAPPGPVPEIPVTPPDPTPAPIDPAPQPTPGPGPPNPDVGPDPGGDPYIPRPTDDAKIVLEGRSASLAYIAGIGNWLADHSYKSADMALKEGNPLTHHAPSGGDQDHGWDPFAGVDAGVFWTNKGSKNKFKTFTFIAGLARQAYNPDWKSSFLLAAFVDGGFADYDVSARYGTTLNPHISGDGSMRYIGGGLMARQRWDNGFRLEASARMGKIRNKFTSYDYLSTTFDPLHYELETPYYALHVGLGHEWLINDKSTIDLLVRYFWTKQDGETYRFVTGEQVTFDDSTSHRLRVGSRYTRLKSERFSWYVGAHYEQEFDGKTEGSILGQPIEVPSLKGGTGIGEIGIIYRSNEDSHFNIETGIQGHVGVRRGISGGVRLGWEF